MEKYINWRRGAAGLALTASILVPFYVLALRPEADPEVLPARLLETSPSGPAAVVGVAEGKLAPDFEIATPEGTRVRLSDLRGRPVLINFWARWCGSCLSEMPVIKALQEERGLETFTVLAVNAGETPAEARQFIDFLEARFVYGLDVDMTVTDAYGVYGLPLSVFVDSSGVIQAVYRGHADRNLLSRFIDAAIASRPPGEVPPVLRIVSTIPRQRLLSVRVEGAKVVAQSRTLRCDTGYCADGQVGRLTSVAGVTRVQLGGGDGRVQLAVEFDRRTTTAETIVEELVRLLDSSPDPLYEGPVQVRYEGG